jgi:hypothetical protein
VESAGWDVVFTTGDKSQDELASFLKDGIEIFMAGQKSKNLSREVIRGRLAWLRKGRWMGGPPPFPAKRINPETGHDLPPGTRTHNGGSLLATDPAKLPHWIQAAQMILAGASLVGVADTFDKLGIPTYLTGRTKDGRVPRWSYQHTRKILTNRALLGELHHTDYDEEGTKRVEVFRAAWDPIVPVDLFQAVQDKLQAADRSKVRRRKKGGVSSYVVPIMCARCGASLTGVDTEKQGGGVNRRYRHPSPGAPVNREVRDRMRAAGCRAWQVDAGEIETALRDLIAAERGSPGFMERLDSMLADRLKYTDAVERKVEDAAATLERIEGEQRNAVRLMTTAQAKGLSEDLFFEYLQRLEAQHTEAKRILAEALAAQEAVTTHRDDVRRLFDETRAILDRWENGDVADRQAILTWWVDHVMIDFEEVERIPKGRVQRQSANLGQRSARRRLIVFLSTLPTGGVQLELPAPRKRTHVGHRTWERVEVRTTPQAQSSGESETSRSPNESEDHRRKNKSKTAGSACCTCSGPGSTASRSPSAA